MTEDQKDWWIECYFLPHRLQAQGDSPEFRKARRDRQFSGECDGAWNAMKSSVQPGRVQLSGILELSLDATNDQNRLPNFYILRKRMA
jgi:hypothetical protein